MRNEYPHQPPKLAKKLLSLFVRSGNRSYLLGDLEENYEYIVKERGRLIAILWYWYQTIIPFPNFLITHINWSLIMFKNYIKISFHNLIKIRNYSVINIIGLTIGVTFIFLTLSYVWDEVNYDSFHENADRIYIVTQKSQIDQRKSANTPAGLRDLLTSEIPEIGKTIRLGSLSCYFDLKEESVLKRIIFTDPELFDLFSFKLKLGSPLLALNSPNKIILSEETAQLLFRNENPLNKVVSIHVYGQKKDFIVSGVLEKIPTNSSLKMDALLPFNLYQYLAMGILTVVEIPDFNLLSNLEKKLPDFLTRNFEILYRNSSFIQENSISLGLQKFTDFHLGDVESSRVLSDRSSSLNSLILTAIAFGVLLLALFNYVNLLTSQNINRFKEFGTRKVLGASRFQIISQFFTESLLISLISIVVAMISSDIFLQELNHLFGKQFSNSFPFLIKCVISVCLLIIISFATSIYPALVISKKESMEIIKGQTIFKQNNFLKRSLIVFQFSLSVFLIAGALIMQKQASFIERKDLGYEPDHVIFLNFSPGKQDYDSHGETFKRFKNDLKKNTYITSVSGSMFLYGNIFKEENTYSPSYIFNGIKVRVDRMWVDYDYFNTLELNIIEGRDFSPQYKTDATDAVLVNENFIKVFNLKNPIGMRISEFMTLDNRGAVLSQLDPVIIGVVKDFNFSSLRKKVRPAMIELSIPMYLNQMIIKYHSIERKYIISDIKRQWDQHFKEKPFAYHFLKDLVNQQYETEQNWAKIIYYSSIFSIFIACLGLFALVSMSVIQRTKEVAIRKILGSSIKDILLLISKDFFLLIILANVLSLPIAYYYAHLWLENFAYHWNMNISIFIVSGLIIFLCSIFTVSFHTIRVGLSNPVDSLRYE